ncbi:alkene reductase [Mycolicibacterium palauense]|uniref:alkene reductase n=1 Tax=Mycolicibacterium palauense TaxID=2034511 RepID=UPI000BFEEBC2|nr:alkene reductase [Mycolicibacterium palauense]
MTFRLDANAALLTPVQIGDTLAANRIFMAPLTRSRAEADGTPSELAVHYYAQRAGAGLIVSEATAVSAQANGAYVNTPGLYTDTHQRAWAGIADAVHDRGGRMFVQLWHVGRMAHPDIGGSEPVAPSAVPAQLIARTPAGKKPLPVPRALDTGEIPGVVESFARAARRAVDAGMDGVEIHAANGYLLHQFLADDVNRRADAYGGSPENRARLAAEVIEAVVAEIGAGRVGVRLSPGNSAGDIHEDDTVAAYEALLHRIAPLGIAYLHLLIDPDSADFAALRGLWQGTVVLNAGRGVGTDFCRMEALADWGVIGAVAAGRSFLANPDLVARLVAGAELNEPDVATFYTPGPVGYTDYPTLDQLSRAEPA